MLLSPHLRLLPLEYKVEVMLGVGGVVDIGLGGDLQLWVGEGRGVMSPVTSGQSQLRREEGGFGGWGVTPFIRA